MNQIKLNKSKYFSGLQCEKKLFLDLNESIKYKNNRPNNKKQLLELSFKYFKNKYSNELPQLYNSDKFSENFKTQKPFYSINFSLDNKDLRLNYDTIIYKDNKITLFLVKSAIYPKKTYIKELALQKYLIEKNYDLEIHTKLILVNKEYQFTNAELNLDKYLNILDCTEKVNQILSEEIATNINNIQKQIKSNKLPEKDIGSHCKNPYQCNYFDYCRINLPDYHVEQIPSQNKDLKETLIQLGISDIKKLPELEPITLLQKRVIDSVKSSKEYISKELPNIIEDLTFPLYYLDFETIISPYKIFPSTKPFEPIPCMWSLHREDINNNLSYSNYYKFSGNDPRDGFIEELINSIGETGNILIYSDFEIRILNMIAKTHPQYASSIKNIINRCVDMLKITKENYYHPIFKGSFSLKTVSKILSDEKMYNMEYVNSGDEASMILIDLITDNIDADLRHNYEKDLLSYAEKDTLNLVYLYHHLKSVS